MKTLRCIMLFTGILAGSIAYAQSNIGVQLINVSCRSAINTGDGTLILGITIKDLPGVSNASLPIMFRAGGPTLATLGVTNASPQVKIAVYRGQTQILENDGWNNNVAITMTSAEVGAFPFRPNSRDSALVVGLAPGSYTVVATGSPGEVLIEAYLIGRLTNLSRITNMSVRSSAPVIMGAVYNGSGQKTMLVRGIGPGLVQFGVGTAHTDPSIRIADNRNNTIGQNDNWGTAAGDLRGMTARVGAFQLPDGSRDAALLQTVALNSITQSFTYVVTGNQGASGSVVLAELYDTAP